MPQLLTLANGGPMPAPTYDAPVFAGLPGGMGQLPERLADGLDVRTGATVRELVATGTGFALTVGPTTAPELVTADAVVLATPAASDRAAARRGRAGGRGRAGRDRVRVDGGGDLRVRRGVGARARRHRLLGLPGAARRRRRIKAATFSFAKWGWVRAAGDGLLLLRTSLGRYGEEAALQASDEELVAGRSPTCATRSASPSRPVDTHVQRWGGGLPQYAVGHLDRVARIRAAVDAVPGLALCGAAYDGVGIPAVIASAHRAAAQAVPEKSL